MELMKIENNPNNIAELLEKNIHVEVDVRYYNDSFYLGHDDPKYKIDVNFLNIKTYGVMQKILKH